MSGKSPLGAINTHRNHTRRGNYDGALVAAKTRATLGCGGPGMAPRYYIQLVLGYLLAPDTVHWRKLSLPSRVSYRFYLLLQLLFQFMEIVFIKICSFVNKIPGYTSF